MLNNEKVIDQIHTEIKSELRNLVETKRQEELEFFVRKSEVQISVNKQEYIYENARLVQPRKEGMTEENLEYFLMLIENCLLKAEPLDTGYIVVNYALNNERTDFEEFKLVIKKENHHSRMKKQTARIS